MFSIYQGLGLWEFENKLITQCVFLQLMLFSIRTRMASGIFIFFMFKLLGFLNEILRLLTLASEHLIACFPLLEKKQWSMFKDGLCLSNNGYFTLIPIVQQSFFTPKVKTRFTVGRYVQTTYIFPEWGPTRLLHVHVVDTLGGKHWQPCSVYYFFTEVYQHMAGLYRQAGTSSSPSVFQSVEV